MSSLLTVLLLTVPLLTACGAQPSAPSVTTTSRSETPLVDDGQPEACTADEWGCAVIQAGGSIVVGTALTMTGPRAAGGLDSQFGAQVALNLRGEVAGHAVELVHRDDACDAEGGTAAATELAGLEGLVGVIGTSCSDSAAPAAELLSASGIVMVSPSNTAPWLTDRGARLPFYYRVAPNDRDHAQATADFACSELGVRTAATVRDGSPWTARLEDSFARAFRRSCGGEVTERAAVESDLSGLSSALSAISTSSGGGPPELVYVALPFEPAVEVWEIARRTAGLQDALLAGVLTGLDGRDAAVSLRPAADIDELYLSAFDLGLGGKFYESIFLEEYARVSGMDTPLGVFHGQAYDAANLLLDAVERVAITADGALYVPRGSLLEAIASTSGIQGLTGNLSCDRHGDCADARIGIWRIEGDTLEPVWP